MNITPIENLFPGSQVVSLTALEATKDHYLALLLQPHGEIEGTANRIGNFDSKRAALEGRNFLELAVRKSANLAVTPEYYLPWETVLQILDEPDTLGPRPGSIWILGCESASLQDLSDFAEKAHAAGHLCNFETIDTAKAAAYRYVDPLVYVFWCADVQNQDACSLAFAIQFKTEPCKDKLDVEHDSLYRGNEIYEFNSGVEDRIRMMTLICSDAFKFSQELVTKCYRNHLFIHIQLNPSPDNAAYARYRDHLFDLGDNSCSELLCLNWAAQVIEHEGQKKPKPWNNNSNSIWYVPRPGFSPLDVHIEKQHKNGLYYSRVTPFWHGFFLHPEPHAILLKKQKAAIIGTQAILAPKSCVDVVERWAWHPKAKEFQTAEAHDGFSESLAIYDQLGGLVNLGKTSVLSVERAVELLMGPMGQSFPWYRADNLNALAVVPRDSVKRVTVDIHRDPNSPAVAERKRRMQCVQDVLSIAGKNILKWPYPLQVLEKGFQLSWSSAIPSHNVVSTTNELNATVIYLSDQSDMQVVDNAYAFGRNCLEKDWLERYQAGKSTCDFTAACDQLVVLYRKNHELHAYVSGQNRSIVRAEDTSSSSITGEGQ